MAAYQQFSDPDWLWFSAPRRAGHHRKRGCRTGHHGRPAAGGPHPERPATPLNAANDTRWAALYDALYGTDVIDEANGAEKGKGYNPVRGAKVDRICPQLPRPGRAAGHWLAPDATGYRVEGGKLLCR